MEPGLFGVCSEASLSASRLTIPMSPSSCSWLAVWWCLVWAGGLHERVGPSPLGMLHLSWGWVLQRYIAHIYVFILAESKYACVTARRRNDFWQLEPCATRLPGPSYAALHIACNAAQTWSEQGAATRSWLTVPGQWSGEDEEASWPVFGSRQGALWHFHYSQ